MVVCARALSSEEIDELEVEHLEFEKDRLPIAFWDGENDELEPLSHGDRQRIVRLGITEHEFTILATEDYLSSQERKKP